MEQSFGSTSKKFIITINVWTNVHEMTARSIGKFPFSQYFECLNVFFGRWIELQIESSCQNNLFQHSLVDIVIKRSCGGIILASKTTFLSISGPGKFIDCSSYSTFVNVLCIFGRKCRWFDLGRQCGIGRKRVSLLLYSQMVCRRTRQNGWDSGGL